ncbi:glycosyl transferase family 41-domain-containing protein [Baffinella frigidus]|nr:glycosyl transferase family 41-domain-containing protein [Cryptophyta sp. CCMP2293]
MPYTQGERNEIFALRPAPVQVLYKGFVGTLGADYISHMVADTRVSPPEFAAHYTERLLYMPHTYVAVDHTLQDEDLPVTREHYGLPPDAFVFCNFNQQYKVDEETLEDWVRVLNAVEGSVDEETLQDWVRVLNAVEGSVDEETLQDWVRVLNAVEGSVLWLIRFGTSKAAETNLQAEAQRLGLLDVDRLVFTNPLPGRLHLHVKALADLFLDTPQYNGHVQRPRY